MWEQWTLTHPSFGPQGLSAEVEVLARDLLKIDRGAKKVKETMKDVSKTEAEFFSEVNAFVSQYEKLLVTLHDQVSETNEFYKKLLDKFGERDTTDSEEVSESEGERRRFCLTGFFSLAPSSSPP